MFWTCTSKSRCSTGRRSVVRVHSPEDRIRYDVPFGKWFQIRVEAFGLPQCPYLKRWMVILFGYSIRLHHWMKSDDKRYFHDHSCDFISIPLRGWYTNCTPNACTAVRPGRIWKSVATDRHYLDIPPCGAWTLLLCGRPYHKWGFWVEGRKMRPWKYFRKFGVIQDETYY